MATNLYFSVEAAVAADDPAGITAMVRAGHSPEGTSEWLPISKTPAMLAAMFGHKECLVALAACGADLAAVHAGIWRPEDFAAAFSHPECERFIADYIVAARRPWSVAVHRSKPHPFRATVRTVVLCAARLGYPHELACLVVAML